MELPFCRKHSQDIDTMLVNRSWVDPDENYIDAAEYLNQIDFVKLEKHYFVICANDLDLDFPNIQNPYCKNEVIISHDFDEECDDLACEDCGRDIFPNTYKNSVILCFQLNLIRKKL